MYGTPTNATRLTAATIGSRYRMTMLRIAFSMVRTGPSHRLFPGAAQANGGVDDSHEAVGLREIAPELARGGIDVFREQAEAGASREQSLKEVTSLLPAAHCSERIHVPERADRESRRRGAEVV